MVQVLPVPALASSRVVPVGQRVADVEGQRHSGPTRSLPVSSGSQTRQACSARPASSRASSGANVPKTRWWEASASSPSMPKALCGSVFQSRRAASAGGASWPSSSLACASAQAPEVATGRGSGSGQPEVAQLDQGAQPLGGAVVERTGQRPLRPGPPLADGVAGPALVGSRGAEGEQVDPGEQPLPRLEPGVAQRHDLVAVDVGDGAGEPAPAAQVDIDVDRPAGSLAQLGGAGPQLLALLGDLAERLLAQHARRERAAQLLGEHHGLRVLAGEDLRQQPVADLPELERVEVDRDRVGQLVGLERRRHVEPPAEERPDRVGEEPLQVGERHVGERPGRERPGHQRRRHVPRTPGGPGACQRGGVEAERLPGDEAPTRPSAVRLRAS